MALEKVALGPRPGTVWEKTKTAAWNLAYKVNKVVVSLLAASFLVVFLAVPMVHIASMSIAFLMEYKLAAIISIVAMAALSAPVGSKISPLKDRFMHSVSEIVEGVQGLAPLSAKNLKWQDSLTFYRLTRCLKSCSFPPNPLQMPDKSLEIINQTSEIQYVKEKNGGLGLVILSKKNKDLQQDSLLPEKQQRDALEAAAIYYNTQISKVYLQVKDLTFFIPILKKIKNLNLVLKNANLQKEDVKALSKLDLNSLELIDSSSVALLDRLNQKIPLFVVDLESQKQKDNLSELQEAFDDALNNKIAKFIDLENIKKTIADFIEDLIQDTDKNYYRLARFGIKLDLSVFKQEELMQFFLSEFFNAGFKVKELVSIKPLTLDFFNSFAGASIEIIELGGLLNFTELNTYLPYLSELKIDLSETKKGKDLSFNTVEFLKSLEKTTVEKVVLKREKTGERFLPYLSFLKVKGQESFETEENTYEVKLYPDGIDKDVPLKDLLDLEKKIKDIDNFKIGSLDLANISLSERNFQDLFNFCGRQEKNLKELILANTGLKADDFISVKNNPTFSFFKSLTFLDLSQNPLLRGMVVLPETVKVKKDNENFNAQSSD